MSKDLDLDLASLWFTKKPVAFPPPSVAGLYPSCNYRLSQTWNARWSMSRWKMILAQTLIIDIQNSNDLSKTTIRLTWDEDNPKRAQALQRHTPPPSPLDPQQLAAAQQRFGDRIARWCERRLGQRVGDGECWTLAHEALQAVAQEDRSRGLEPVMASQGRVHGCRIYVHEVPSKGSAAGGMEVAGVARGDIVEFESARVRQTEAVHHRGGRGTRTHNVTLGHHTVIVTGIKGEKVDVVEQNGQEGKRVGRWNYDIADMQSGRMLVYRPVGEQWCPPLDAKW